MYILFLQTCWIATVFSLEFNVRTILHFFCTNTRTNDMFKNGLNYKEREINVVFRMEIQNKVVHNDTHTQGIESCSNS